MNGCQDLEMDNSPTQSQLENQPQPEDTEEPRDDVSSNGVPPNSEIAVFGEILTFSTEFCYIVLDNIAYAIKAKSHEKFFHFLNVDILKKGKHTGAIYIDVRLDNAYLLFSQQGIL